MQALMDVNITVKAEVVVAFWTADMDIRLATCNVHGGIVNEPHDYST